MPKFPIPKIIWEQMPKHIQVFYYPLPYAVYW